MPQPVNNLLRQFFFLTILFLYSAGPFADPDGRTVMQVLVVFGAPGHSSIHLQRHGRQIYWDPGGAYGTEKDDCLEYNSETFCSRFDGFPLERLKRNRRFDVFVGDDADLLRVISIYHLDGDVKSQVYRFELHGDMGRRAWDLLHQGGLKGGKAPFGTDRSPMFCVKGVTEYLAELGGQFEDMPRPWFPSDLAEALGRLGAKPSHVYTLHDPEVSEYIQHVRREAGLAALRLEQESSFAVGQRLTLPAGLEIWQH